MMHLSLSSWRRSLAYMHSNCEGTFCGVFRRQALDRGATIMKADKIVTGHNADDIAETVLMNRIYCLAVLKFELWSDLHFYARCSSSW